jgi:2-succinyl-6-hydroxy-2,4-cyclohexadiene-1-carboxylate synthase
MSILAINGIKLNVEVEGEGPPLVLLHGFTGSGASWHKVAQELAPHYTVITIDALGHGKSSIPLDPIRYSMPYVASDFVAVLDALNINQALLLGYSMGGRMALHIATVAPQRLRGLILESASPGLRTNSERAARVQSDEQLAQLLETQGLENFVHYWEQLPLFESQQRLPVATRQTQHHQRLQNNPIGLANSLRGAGTGRQEPLWDKLKTLTIPTLLIAGQLDTKYFELAQEMLDLIPTSTLVGWKDCGHTVHLENSHTFAQAVLKFLRLNKLDS